MRVRIDRVKLITEMARKDITTEQLAELAGISRATVTATRSGKSCSAATANKLAAGLGVKAEDILEKEDK